MLSTIVKNGKYHLAKFNTIHNQTICEFENCVITLRDPDPSKALFMIEYLHDLRFIESKDVKEKFPQTTHYSLSQLVDFLNSLDHDPFPSSFEILI